MLNALLMSVSGVKAGMVVCPDPSIVIVGYDSRTGD
jgi:hypothetical protein